MKIRERLIAWLFHISIGPYAILFKSTKESWGLTANDLLDYPSGSLGQATGLFLTKNSFELMDRLEAHDTYHVITGYGTDVPNEIAQQYFLFGNGKRTLYVVGVLLLSLILLPDNMKQYLTAYRRGQASQPIHTLDMKTILYQPLLDIKSHIFTTKPKISANNIC